MQASKLATQDGKEEVRTYYGIVCNLLIGKFDQGLHCPPMAQGLGKISQFKDYKRGVHAIIFNDASFQS
jgi:hypothetical protein